MNATTIVSCFAGLHLSLFLLLRTHSRWPKEHVFVPVVLHFHLLFGATAQDFKLLKLKKTGKTQVWCGPHHHLHFLLMLMAPVIEDPFPVLFKCFLKVHQQFTGIVLADFVQSHQKTLAFLSGKGSNFHLFQKLPQCMVLQVQKE